MPDTRGNSSIFLKYINSSLQKWLPDDQDTVLVRGYFTSDQPDMTGDIITREATDNAVATYRKWGNVRYMHQPKPVGKVKRIGEKDGMGWNEVEIRVVDPGTVFDVKNNLLTALSVGILVNFDDITFLEDGGWQINAYTLAEISLVDHPANYDAALTSVKGLCEGTEATLRGVTVLDMAKTVIPYKDTGTTDEDKPWSRPTLSDFTDKGWGDLSDSDKRRIAGHFTFSINYPPQSYGDLKLPHHEASKDGIGAANWHGVSNAMARLPGTDIPADDKGGCESHLLKHYDDFGKEHPKEDVLEAGIEEVIEGEIMDNQENTTEEVIVEEKSMDETLEVEEEVIDKILDNEVIEYEKSVDEIVIEELVGDELPEEEVVEKVLDETPAEEVIEEELQTEFDPASILQELVSLKQMVADLTEMVKTLAEAVPAEDEQSSGEDHQELIETLQAENKSLTEQVNKLSEEITELRLPHTDRGGMPETGLPEEASEDESDEKQVDGDSPLKVAVRKYAFSK